ncbi:MAG: VTT domain-containing protein [Xanthomonadales bacterium]|nr:VTT domain-containing protein [Xanthomonadales bacterium]
MRLFGPLYDRTLALARHPRAPLLLGAVSAAESVVFPVPPDVMLIPMSLAAPRRALAFATLCTLASVAGGLLGWLLGRLALEAVYPWIESAGYAEGLVAVRELFSDHGFWIVLTAGFTPIPYKLFTVGAGAFGVGLLPFLLASLLGRGGRFFLVAGLIRLGGERMEMAIRARVERLGWIFLLAVVLLGAWWWLR